MPSNPPAIRVFALGQLGPPVEFVLDCRPDERARARVAPRFDGFIDPIPIFPAQSRRRLWLRAPFPCSVA